MLSWLAINFNAARLGFEAQNALAFGLLRLAGGTTSRAPDNTSLITSLPNEQIAPKKEATRQVKGRASVSKVHRKSSRSNKRTLKVKRSR
jgi:hypothetical protein